MALGAARPAESFGSVLTNRGKGRSDSDLEQFFRSGAEEIAAVLQRAARLGQLVSRRRALDFGCGVGRLTQAMAYHFERCDGVDISASILAEGGGRPVDVEEDLMPGGFQNCRYWVGKG